MIGKCILRWGLVGALALGGATLLWPDHVALGLDHARDRAQSVLEKLRDDPVALRRELAKLADEYPERIAEVRGEISEVDVQLAQFERDIDVAERVVAMTNDDLRSLKTLVAKAEAERESGTRTVAIRFDGVRFDIDEAYAEGRRIAGVRNTFTDRLEQDKFQMNFLAEQKTRLNEILAKLEDEYDTYQSQLWQLDRQIDAIQRNERLIELTEQQQATIAGFDKLGRVQNLKQLEAKLAQMRTEQEARLQALSKQNFGKNYEDRAAMSIDGAKVLDDPFADIEEIRLDGTETEKPAAEIGDHDSIAWLDSGR